jgi:UDP-N-acetylglucosamine 2-epimerase (non-hydrolysing)
MKKITLIVGTRPNFMKAFPVYKALKNNFELTLIHTGQHYDAKMSDIFFEQLDCPKPDILFSLESKSRAGSYDDKLYVNNLDYLMDKNKVILDLLNADSAELGQLGEIRDKLIEELERIQPDMVMIFGDVTSTLAGALASKKLCIRVAHVESGLRSHDMSMPEEVNRILTDSITDIYFVTEQSGVDNLKAEGLYNDNVYLVGNTMIDSLLSFKDIALATQHHKVMGFDEQSYVLVTLHRPSNVDDLTGLRKIMLDLINLSNTDTIIFPIHPRTRKNISQLNITFDPTKIVLCEPLGYLEFVCLEANAKYVITDSGGVQEETTSFDVPCYTLRPNTERPYTLVENGGTNKLVEHISDIIVVNVKCVQNELIDGKASERILNVLDELLHAEYLSIGGGCLASGMLQQMGLKKSSYPFDWLSIRSYNIKK